MEYQFNNERAIYLQIVDLLITKIINNEYPINSKLPTVRELALIMKVNPNTMQRAFSELEKLGIIISRRTSGRYVCSDVKILNSFNKDIATKVSKEYLEKMNKYGYSKQDIINLINENRED